MAFASSSIFLYAGAFYGWGPMQLLLEANGNFHKKCAVNDYPNNDGVCPGANRLKNEQFVFEAIDPWVCQEQTMALLNVRFVSQYISNSTTLVERKRFGSEVLPSSVIASDNRQARQDDRTMADVT